MVWSAFERFPNMLPTCSAPLTLPLRSLALAHASAQSPYQRHAERELHVNLGGASRRSRRLSAPIGACRLSHSTRRNARTKHAAARMRAALVSSTHPSLLPTTSTAAATPALHRKHACAQCRCLQRMAKREKLARRVPKQTSNNTHEYTQKDTEKSPKRRPSTHKQRGNRGTGMEDKPGIADNNIMVVA